MKGILLDQIASIKLKIMFSQQRTFVLRNACNTTAALSGVLIS